MHLISTAVGTLILARVHSKFMTPLGVGSDYRKKRKSYIYIR